MVMGYNDRMRVARLNSYKIAEAFRGSRDMPGITEFYSLPFDDELRKLEREEMEKVATESERIYKEAMAAGYFTTKIEDLVKN